MNLQELKALVESGESETLEFKKTIGSRREAAKTVCAFLNQNGGRVLFGVTERGAVAGQEIGERTIEDVSDELHRLDPPVLPSIKQVPVGGGRKVIVVEVEVGPMRPYRYKGAAYRRVGNTTRAMSAEEYNRMLFERMHSDQRWENQPAVGWSIDDLDAAEIRNTIEEARQSGRLNVPPGGEPADLLRGLGLLHESVPLRAGVVLFGNPNRLEAEMPQCLLRVARFRGSDRAHFLDNRQFNGNAFTLLASAEHFLRHTLPIVGRFKGDRFVRVDEPLYPLLAIREAVANALCHRDYSVGGGSVGIAIYDDRLEVTSSGPLRFGLTPEKLLEPHDPLPWNPLIARTFFRRGVIEDWGSGTLTMARLMNEAGLPTPEIEDDGATVTVRFRHSQPDTQPVAMPRVGSIQRRGMMLELLDTAGDGGLALRELIARMAPFANERQVSRDLEALKKRKQVTVSGRGASARWKRLK